MDLTRHIRHVFVISLFHLALTDLFVGHAQEPPASGQDQPVSAQEQPTAAPPRAEDTDYINVEPVVFSATRSERTLADLPVSATIMDRKQVKESPAIATDDIIRTIPSLNLPLGSSFASHPTSLTVGIRGIGAPRVLFLLDGIPINDPFFGYVQFNKIVRETIERVEVVRGGMSSIWGNYAMGGLVNIVTRQTDKKAANMEVLYGSNSTFRTNLYGSQRLTDNFGISINVNYFDTNGYFVTPSNIRGAGDARAADKTGNVQLKADYRSGDVDWFVRSNFFTMDQRTQVQIDSNATNSVDLATGARWRLDKTSDLRANLFYLQQEFRTDNADPSVFGSRDLFFLSNLHHTPVTDIGGSMQYIKRFGEIFPELMIGYDFRRIQGEDRAINFSAPGAAPRVENAGGTQIFHGAYAQASFKPVPLVEILPSVRVDYYHNTNGHDQQAPGATARFEDKSIAQVNPKVAARYQIVEPVALRAAFYRGFRAPNLDNLYRPFTAVGFGLRPNPFLSPEVLYGGDAGLDLNVGRFKGQVNYFRNEVNNQIGSTVTSFFPVFTVQKINVGKARSRGVELIGELQLMEGLSVIGGYTYTDARIVEDPNPAIIGKVVPGVYRHFGTFTIQYRHVSGARSIGQAVDNRRSAA